MAGYGGKEHGEDALVVVAVRIGRDNSVRFHEHRDPGEHHRERQDDDAERAARVFGSVFAECSDAVADCFDTGKRRTSARVSFQQQPKAERSGYLCRRRFDQRCGMTAARYGLSQTKPR